MVINSPSSVSTQPSSPNRSISHLASPSKASFSSIDLPIRTACNFCRSKKVKCDKTAVEDGGCARCKREKILCCYDVRDPIGRPKKRRMTEDSSSAQSSSTVPHASPQPARMTKNESTDSGLSHTEAARFLSQPNASTSLLASKSSSFNALYPSLHSSTISSSSSQWPQMPPFNVVTQKNNAYHGMERPQNSKIRNKDAFPSNWQSMSPSNQSFQSSAVPSYGMTPSSSSPATFETVRPSGIDDAPNLSDLGLAAFLESLDTLEINKEDGLTSTMLEALATSSLKEDIANAQLHQQSFLPSLSSSINSIQNTSNLQGSTSYAVPADLSWADSSWLDQISAQSTLSLDKMNRTRIPESFIHDRHPTPISINRMKVDHQKRVTSSPQAEKARSCCCGKEDASFSKGSEQMQNSQQQEPTSRSENSSTRVHCVPDPNGKGCTCLCDVSVALINVRATLRQTKEDQSERLCSMIRNDDKRAASTLQLTLSASQAVTAQCACSASCPTCRSDPSTSLSASLLVSTALQIYIRAVRTLRQGFGASDSGSSLNETIGGMENGHVHATGSEWDVSIGQYKPKATNARRIALFAMKLELRDLRDAIAKVSRAASRSGAVMTNEKESLSKKGFCSTSTASELQHAESAQSAHSSMEAGINPVDQVVIRKLHQQLGDLLRTVEGIEEQQDAERNILGTTGNELMHA